MSEPELSVPGELTHPEGPRQSTGAEEGWLGSAGGPAGIGDRDTPWSEGWVLPAGTTSQPGFKGKKGDRWTGLGRGSAELVQQNVQRVRELRALAKGCQVMDRVIRLASGKGRWERVVLGPGGAAQEKTEALGVLIKSKDGCGGKE